MINLSRYAGVNFLELPCPNQAASNPAPGLGYPVCTYRKPEIKRQVVPVILPMLRCLPPYLDIMPEQMPEQLFVYERKARRLELLIRIGYWIVIGIVTWVYAILALICLFIQWFFILVMGRRQQGLSDFARGYFEYIISRMPYMYFMTDKRPNILPDPEKIFVEKGEGP
jgi:hypothetical protein